MTLCLSYTLAVASDTTIDVEDVVLYDPVNDMNKYYDLLKTAIPLLSDKVKFSPFFFGSNDYLIGKSMIFSLMKKWSIRVKHAIEFYNIVDLELDNLVLACHMFTKKDWKYNSTNLINRLTFYTDRITQLSRS